MEQINDLLKGIQPGQAEGMKRSRNISKENLAKMWHILYNRKLVTGVVDSSEYKVWAHDLKDMTEAEITAGLENCKKHIGWFSVGVFIDYCNQGNGEYPKERDAYLEAMNHSHEWKTYQFTHPVVLGALKMSNILQMRTMPEKKSSKIYYRNYAVACRRYSDGLPLDVEIPLALPEKIEHRLTPKERKSRMAKMRKELDV